MWFVGYDWLLGLGVVGWGLVFAGVGLQGFVVCCFDLFGCFSCLFGCGFAFELGFELRGVCFRCVGVVRVGLVFVSGVVDCLLDWLFWV